MKAIAWYPMPIIKPALEMPSVMSLVSFGSLVMRMDSHLDQLLLPPRRWSPTPLPLILRAQGLWVGVHDVTARCRCSVWTLLSPGWLDVSG